MYLTFIGSSISLYPSGGVISVIVYSPVMYFPSTYWYSPSIVNIPFSSVVIYSPPSFIPSPSILNCAPDNVVSWSFAYLVICRLYVGIFSFTKLTSTLSSACLPLTSVLSVICALLLKLPLIVVKLNVPLLLFNLNFIGSCNM